MHSGIAADRGGHDRHAGGHRFQSDHRQIFGQRRDDANVERRHHGRHVGALARPVDLFFDAQLS